MNELEKQRQIVLKEEKKHSNKVKLFLVVGAILFLVLFIVHLWITDDFSIDYLKSIFINKSYKYDPYDSRIDDLLFIIPTLSFLILVLIIIALRGGTHRLNENNKEYQKYQKMFKNLVVTEALKEMFEDVETDYDKGIPKEIIKETEILKLNSIYTAEDYHKGKYKNINFECSDVLIQHIDLTNKEDKLITDFIGQWYIFDFNKKINGKIIIRKAETDDQLKPNYIQIEDPEFNKYFSIFSEDRHSAYYVLTPNFMEKIKKLDNEYAQINICIFDNKIQIGVNYTRKDLFEVGYHKQIDYTEAKEYIKSQLNDIINIIDILNLDNDLYK